MPVLNTGIIYLFTRLPTSRIMILSDYNKIMGVINSGYKNLIMYMYVYLISVYSVMAQ